MSKRRDLHLYRVERYRPGLTEEPLCADLDRVAAVAAGLTAQGRPVRYLGSTFAPEEESCFSVFESDTRSIVEEVCARAELGDVRITEVREFPPRLDRCDRR